MHNPQREPSTVEIRRACETIQNNWTVDERRRRRVEAERRQRWMMEALLRRVREDESVCVS